MDRARVDYDRLAPRYDTRYAVDGLQGIADALLSLAVRYNAASALEVGCGTGHWLRELRSKVAAIYGADASLGMLRSAVEAGPPVVAARANALPFHEASFDLVFSVNAVHHFDDPEAFVGQAAELLKHPGALSITGLDPHLIPHWYLYDYFEGARERDLLRYPSVGDLVNWMARAGFDPIECRTVEERNTARVGRSVLSDPFLAKHSNSLLALLSDQEYAAGLQRIEQSILQAEKEGREISFLSELPFIMITGFRE